MALGVGSLIGTAVVGLAGWGYLTWRRHRKVKASWRAIAAELEQVREKAEAITGGTSTQRPLWRMPVEAFASQWNTVLEHGGLSQDEMHIITSHFQEVVTLNRGLDLAQDAETSVGREREHGRNVMKAERMIGGCDSYRAVRTIMDRHVQREWWEGLRLP